MPLFRNFLVAGLVLLMFKLSLFSQVAFAPAGVYSVGYNPWQVIAGDLNGDGKPDIVSANDIGNSLSVLTNDGHGNFKLASTISSPGSECLCVADFNNDNKPDLVAGNTGPDTVSIFTNRGGGAFLLASTATVAAHPMSLVVADVNNDGKKDVIVGNYNNASFGNSLTILTNAGNGILSTATSPSISGAGYSVAAADFNGDGFVDAVSAGVGYLNLLTNTHSGGFAQTLPPPISYGSQKVATADFDGDGNVDLVTINPTDNRITVSTNNGSGLLFPLFQISVASGMGSLFSPILTQDVNGDGAVDLVYGFNQGVIYNQMIFVLTNNGSGIFAVACTTPAISPQSIASADFNGDGKPDLVAANSAVSKVTVYFSVPTLNINRSNNNLAVSWPSSWTNWVLQQSADFSPASWTNSSGIFDDGTNKILTIAPHTESLFFRLAPQ